MTTTYVTTYDYGNYTHTQIVDEFTDLVEATTAYHELVKELKEDDSYGYEADSVALEQWTGSLDDNDSEYQETLMTEVYNEYEE